MKATLEFNLPEELDEFKTSADAGRMKDYIYQFSTRLRDMRKHGHPYKDIEDCIEGIETIFYHYLGEFIE